MLLYRPPPDKEFISKTTICASMSLYFPITAVSDINGEVQILCEFLSNSMNVEYCYDSIPE